MKFMTLKCDTDYLQSYYKNSDAVNQIIRYSLARMETENYRCYKKGSSLIIINFNFKWPKVKIKDREKFIIQDMQHQVLYIQRLIGAL